MVLLGSGVVCWRYICFIWLIFSISSFFHFSDLFSVDVTACDVLLERIQPVILSVLWADAYSSHDSINVSFLNFLQCICFSRSEQATEVIKHRYNSFSHDFRRTDNSMQVTIIYNSYLPFVTSQVLLKHNWSCSIQTKPKQFRHFFLINWIYFYELMLQNQAQILSRSGHKLLQNKEELNGTHNRVRGSK